MNNNGEPAGSGGADNSNTKKKKDDSTEQTASKDLGATSAAVEKQSSQTKAATGEGKGQASGFAESVGSREKAAGAKGQAASATKKKNYGGGQAGSGGAGGGAAKRGERDRAGQRGQAPEEGGSQVGKGAEAKGGQAGAARGQEGKEKAQYQKQVQKNKQIVGQFEELKAKKDGKASSPLSNAERVSSSSKLLLQTPGDKDEQPTHSKHAQISSQQATTNARGRVLAASGMNNPEEREESVVSGLQAKASACGASSTEQSMNKREKKFMRKQLNSIQKEPAQNRAQNAVIEEELEMIRPAGAMAQQLVAQGGSLPQSQGTNQQTSPEKSPVKAEPKQAWSKQSAIQMGSSSKTQPNAEATNDIEKNAEMQIVDDEAGDKKERTSTAQEGHQAAAPLSIEAKIREAIPKMKPTIAEKFDQVDGACEYFFILERENEKVQDQIQHHQIQKKVLEKEQAAEPGPHDPKAGQELQAKIEDLQKTLHDMPKGYPQKYMYKYPKIDALRCQTQVDSQEYKGSVEKYLADNADEGDQAVEAAAKQLRVYRDQKVPIRVGFGEEQEGKEQQREPTIHAKPAMKKRRGKRSRSEEIETLKFENGEDAESSSESEFEKQMPNLRTAKKDTFKFESYNQRKIQRRDELQAPAALKPEPKLLFLGDQNGSKYTPEQLDEYLKICDTIMRDTPVQGGYCGIWLRGSSMYHENAMKLLHLYDYNFDLAKFHALYPMVMNDPRKRREMQEIARSHPIELAKEVANAIIDLRGCKAEEVNEILQNFRNDLQNRIGEDRLQYHLAILAKIKEPMPADIEQKIADSVEFSRLLKRKCAGSTRTATHIPQDKKLKLSELVDLHEQQQSYCYITQEMIALEQQLAKARHWAELVESIRGQEVQLRTIEQIYQEGKNIPVNFQELMNEVKARKTQAEQLDQRIRHEIALRRTRREANVGTGRRPGRSGSAAAGTEDAANEDSKDGGQPDKEQIFRDLLEEAQKAKLLSDSIQKLQMKVNDIDKWKAEVRGLFRNRMEEEANYKRYREHYRGLLARSQAFHIELSLMKNLQKKCHLIDWRDRVEETWKKVASGTRLTLEQLEHVLEDGRERRFLAKDGRGAYTISQYIRDYHARFSWPENQGTDAAQDKEQPEQLQILMPLIQNFQSLDKLIAIHHEASQFDWVIRTILRKLRGAQGESSSSAEDASMSNGGAQAAGETAAGASGASAPGGRAAGADAGGAVLGLSSLSESVDRKNRIQFSFLEELESKGLGMRVEIDKFKEFRTKLEEIRDVAQHCQALIQAGAAGPEQDGVFRITSESGLKDVLEARKSFLSLNVISKDFMTFQQNFQPYIFWINKSVETIKTYCRALGLKQNQLNLLDPIQDSESSDSECEAEPLAGGQNEQGATRVERLKQPRSTNPFAFEMDYQSLKALCAELVPPGQQSPQEDAEMDGGAPVKAADSQNKSQSPICGLGKFLFFRDTNHGKYLLQILAKTNALIGDFHKMKEQKLAENFDLNAYFKLLDNFYNCGLPVEPSIVEEAKAELKREKWIKKYIDIQMMGNQRLHVAAQQQLNGQGQAQDSQHTPAGKQQLPPKPRQASLLPNGTPGPESSLQNEGSPSLRSPGSAVSRTAAQLQSNLKPHPQQNAGGSTTGPPAGASNAGHIKIKNLEVLLKEYQASPEINQDETCKAMAARLQEQQRNCQNWLDKFQKLFNSVGQFDPRGGLQEVRDLLEEGERLELKLKELHELQIHQRDLNDWKRVTARIFDQTRASGEPVTLEQLEKHIKDTLDITEGANPQYVQLLQALKDLATIWKIKARTILKIRPNETVLGLPGAAFSSRQCPPKDEDLGEGSLMRGTSLSDSQLLLIPNEGTDGQNDKGERSQPGMSGNEAVTKQQPALDGELAHERQRSASLAGQEQNEQDQDLFCICRQPENGSLMLCCDFCDMWYHYTCIGLPQDLKLLEKVKYKCIGCAIREGRFSYALPPPGGPGSDPSSALPDPQGYAGLYAPVMPNRLQVLRDLEQDKHLNHRFFQAAPKQSGDSSVMFIQPNQPPEASAEPQVCQQEIEKLLLEHFFTKGRIHLEQFQQVLREGRESIPLMLEELEELTMIEMRIDAWRDRAKKAIEAGPKAHGLWLNFQKINGSVEAKESEVIALQEQERMKDQELVDILVESESFPVLLYEAKKLVQILHFRDWLRECFPLLYQFNSSLPKVNKIKLRKYIKRLTLKGEVITCLAPELVKFKMKAGKPDSKSSSAHHEGALSSQQESMSQYQEALAELRANSEVEANAVYMSWLLSNLSGSGQAAKPDAADKLNHERTGLNWVVDWRKDLKPQVKFWEKNVIVPLEPEGEAIRHDNATVGILPDQVGLFPLTPSPEKAESYQPIVAEPEGSEFGAMLPGSTQSATKQRMGVGIIKINIEEDVENELRVAPALGERVAATQSQEVKVQMDIQPADRDMTVDELPTGGEAAIGRPGEQLQGRIAAEDKDPEASLKHGAGSQAGAQESMPGLLEQSPEIEGQTQALILPGHAAEVQGAQSQSDLIQLLQGQHDRQDLAVGPASVEPQMVAGAAASSAGLFPPALMSLHGQPPGKQELSQEQKIGLERRQLLDQDLVGQPGDQTAPIQSMASVATQQARPTDTKEIFLAPSQPGAPVLQVNQTNLSTPALEAPLGAPSSPPVAQKLPGTAMSLLMSGAQHLGQQSPAEPEAQHQGDKTESAPATTQPAAPLETSQSNEAK